MYNMCVILLVIVNSVIHAAHAEEEVIEFNAYEINSDYQCGPVNKPIALEDDPTTIRVYVNSSTDFVSGHCEYQQQEIELSKIENSKNTFLTTKKLVFKNGKNKWTCHFYPSVLKKATNCDTQFHLRTKTPVAHIYLNFNEMAATRTSLDVREYDAKSLHHFYDGETVVIECKRSQPTGYSKMVYFNNTGGILSETDYLEMHLAGISIHLTKRCHSNYVDCYYKKSYSNEDEVLVFVTRMVFELQSVHSENDFDSKYWMIGGIIMIVITIIIILYNVRNYKNKRNKRQSNNMSHINLPCSGDSPLSNPSQNDEAVYTELIESEMYNYDPGHENKMISKGRTNNDRNDTSKNISESNYANMDVVMESALDYANVLTVNDTINKKKTDNSRVRFTDTSTSGSNNEHINMIQCPSYMNVGEEPAEHIYCEVR